MRTIKNEAKEKVDSLFFGLLNEIVKHHILQPEIKI